MAVSLLFEVSSFASLIQTGGEPYDSGFWVKFSFSSHRSIRNRYLWNIIKGILYKEY
jgi:hypothetical protein